ncbi:MAG: hypothetical protein CVV27_12045 [Candidatus Melainabacteria bacterium HGW-Melainabacteria-1]|nr:MAG: hypothetical protein CVV27_12045 [Candidatus Melainabacteria bacterium HGW-Melainabacteria-1]
MLLKRVFCLLALFALLLTGCGHWEEIDSAVSAATKRGLGDYSGTLDTANLVPISYVNEPPSAATLGRTFKFAGPRLVSLNTSSACRNALPGQPVSNSDGAVSKFSYAYVQMIDQSNGGQGQLKLDYLGYAGNVRTEIREKSLLAAKVWLSDILAYPASAANAPNWAEFESCCKLTGTCGDYVVTELYQMSQTVKGLVFTETNLTSALQASGVKVLEAIQNVSGTVDFVHKSSQSFDLGVDKTFWSHFGFRQLPPAAEAPLDGVFLAMEPNKLDCSTAPAKPVDLRLNFSNAAGTEASRMLGYNISIPSGWEQISLKNPAHAELVKVAEGDLSCRPLPGKTCPTALELKATPPDCGTVQDLIRSDWKAQLALFIPGSGTGYRPQQQSAATLVVPSKLKHIPDASLSKSVLTADLRTGMDGHVKTSLTVNTGDLSAPQFRVIAPTVNFAQVVVYPPQQKKVELEISISPAICADFNLNPILHLPMQVIVWGKRPGAVDSSLFEVPPVNITVKPLCPAKPRASASPQSEAPAETE